MGSKYQINAKKKSVQKKQGGPRYYDENVKKQTNMSSGIYVFIVVAIIIGAGAIVGTQLFKNNNTPTNTSTGTTTTTSSTTTTTTPSGGVQLNDNVKMIYTLWAATPGSGPSGVIDTSQAYADPDEQPPHPQDHIEFTNIIKTGNGGLILGYVNNVLGMKEGETKTFNLPANIDNDGNGIDDNTGQQVLSYGQGKLANTNIRFEVTIVTIY
ncbi:MAG: Tir C-terminal domain-containing protein [Promethearchaeota archaeon]